MNGDVNIDSSKLFTVKAPNMARGHAMKVHLKKISNSDIRHNFFTERVIVPWNTLPQHIVESKTVKEFKNSYDKWSGLIVQFYRINYSIRAHTKFTLYLLNNVTYYIQYPILGVKITKAYNASYKKYTLVYHYTGFKHQW